MQVAAPGPGRTPLRSENVCRDSGRRNEAAPAASVRIALACLKARGTTLVRRLHRTGFTLRLNRDARASRSRFAEPNSQVPLSSERFSQPRELGKTAGIAAGRGLSPVMSRTGRPDGEGAAGSPRLRRRCGPPWSTLRPPANGPADPRAPCGGEGPGSVLGAHPELA